MVVSIGALAVMLVLRRVAPQVPGQLVVVVGGIALVAFTGIEQTPGEDGGLALIDSVPTGLPHLDLPVAGDVLALLPGALAIAVMAFLETVLVARTNRRREEPPIDTDQELLAVGVASVAGGFAQSLPPAGGFSQSAVNLRSGARTQLAQLVTAGLAVLVALLLAPLLDDLPRAVLAAMVAVAVLGLLDPRDLVTYARIDRAEFWVAVVVAGLCLTGGMLLGVAAGVGLTLVLVLRAVNQPHVAVVPGPDDAVLRLILTGGIYTGNAQVTYDAALGLVRAAQPPPHTVDLDLSRVTRVTIPLLDGLRSFHDQLALDSVDLHVTGASPDLLEVLRRWPWWRDHEGG